jgi:hypothetical protein
MAAMTPYKETVVMTVSLAETEMIESLEETAMTPYKGVLVMIESMDRMATIPWMRVKEMIE